ncbi:amidophosphoribosyltransferase [Chlorogloeopsis sp. ULAP02]|uniref:amidophosphoribosyltransferase n=1 Tax=Chlorogloeopsis sp. ULAP02 TaxID=3107926 RepID=UPI0031351215
MKDNCGIFAAYDLTGLHNVIPNVIDGLSALQHRGQLSAGITYHNPYQGRALQTFKANGLVRDVFKGVAREQFTLSDVFSGTAVIGHVRYATCGTDEPELAQPFEWQAQNPSHCFAFCFAGNLTNYAELGELIERAGFHLQYGSDAEALTFYLGILRENQAIPDICDLFRQMQKTVDGAFNCAYLDAEGNLSVYRDRYGFRPLHYTITDDGFVFFASETNALLRYGKNIKAVKPGELICVHKNLKQVKSTQLFTPQRSHCFFEFVYFSHLASTFEDIPIYQAREKLGENLAVEESEEIDGDCVVISVPESASIIGRSYANVLGLPHKDGIISSRYSGRTFIERERSKKAYEKYSFVSHVIDNKRVFIVDDSLVRATTLRAILELIQKQCTPKEIHLRIACPPILSPCFYGIDIPNQKELFASAFAVQLNAGMLPTSTLNQMAEILNVKSLRFLSLEGLLDAIDIKIEDTCLACINSQYPTPGGVRLFNKMQRVQKHMFEVSTIPI